MISYVSQVIAEDVKATLAQRLDLRINEQQKVGKILSQYPQSLFGYSKDMQGKFMFLKIEVN